jgi:hypothetical protein
VPLADDLKRIEAVRAMLLGAVQLQWTPTAASTWGYRGRLRQGALALRPVWYRGSRGDPLDYELQAELAEHYAKPMATAKTSSPCRMPAPHPLRRDAARARLAAIRLRAELRLVEYLRTLDMLKNYGWSPSRCIPHGGHQMSLNIAAGLGLGGNESYPDLFQPYGGFPDGVRVESGYITMPDLPGIGFEGKADLYAEMRSLAA